jgi:hypothetical protein
MPTQPWRSAAVVDLYQPDLIRGGESASSAKKLTQETAHAGQTKKFSVKNANGDLDLSYRQSALGVAPGESYRPAMTELDVDQAAAKLSDLAGEARARGAITFVVDGTGRRLAAVVPVEVAEQALRLRAEAEAIEV